MRSLVQRLFVLGFFSMLAACGRSSSVDSVSASPSPAATLSLQTGLCHVVPLEKAFCTALTLATPSRTLRLAVADTPERRAHGLMGTTDVPPGEGMLFVFPEAGNAHHEFWMKDTPVALDLVYLGADGTVTAVFAGLPASRIGAPDASVAKRQAVGKFVIELRAGGAADAGLKPGTAIDMPVTVAE